MKNDMLGALLGWSAQPLGHRLTLRLQVASKPPPIGKSDIDSYHLVLDRNQAVQLGYYLFMVTGQTPVPPERTWLQRLLGR